MCFVLYLFRSPITDECLWNKMRRKRNNLVPLDKSKRVIYLERRGQKKVHMTLGSVAFGILGILCILYCIAIAFAGFGTKFFLIWGAMGTACLLLCAALANRKFMDALPVWLKGIVAGLFCLGLLLFCTVEIMILSRFRAAAQPGADYCIVLGAQWKPDGPSEVLRRRLDKAVEYLNANPNTIVIVSGGQGSNEIVSEAAGMRQYLMDVGIEEERILAEDKSTNTRENLAFSAELLDKENSRVVVVTNNFHVFRALKIAEKQGYHAEGLAANSVTWMVPNNMLREFFGVLKDYLTGNM